MLFHINIFQNDEESVREPHFLFLSVFLLTQLSANVMVRLNWHFKEIFMRCNRAYTLQTINITEPVFPISSSIIHYISCDANMAQYYTHK